MARGREVADAYFARRLEQARGVLLSIEPAPRPLPASEIFDADAAPRIRRLDCSRYNACLDVAFAARWDGFGCASCGAHLPLDPEASRRDMDGLGDLLWALRTVR